MIFLFICHGIHAQNVKFSLPLKGIPGKDYLIDVYVDHDSSNKVEDAFCGTKTYNSHRGTDFSLRSFKTMDSGVYVYAAADGQIYELHDGEFDRSTYWAGGGFGNYVKILHRDSLCTYYGHLMKNSLLVKFGDSVKAGQPIGKVGSSGQSGQPHLHFEVSKNGQKVIDPFVGNCSPERNSLWEVQPLDDTGVYAIENGFVPYKAHRDWLLERYQVSDTFYIHEDSLVCFWVFMHGLQKGNEIRADWYTPGGWLYFSCHYVWTENWWHDYTWPYIRMQNKKGKWSVKLYVNDRFVTSRNFYIVKR